MEPLQQYSLPVVTPPRRDTVAAFQDHQPAIISISDIHGHLNRARSALLSLQDHDDYDPVVVKDGDEQLHWADEDYVLVFNGDLVDRGDKNEAVLRMVSRLAAEAPPGRVRVTLGNHEAIAVSADHYPYESWYAGRADTSDRRALLKAIEDGVAVAAYEGYNYKYAHAGGNEEYEVSNVNENLINAADELLAAVETDQDLATQRAVIDEYPRVLGTGDVHPKSEGAGISWLGLSHLAADAPPQIVGHTKQTTPIRKGTVVCQDVIMKNDGTPGGEAVLVETPDELVALIREGDGDVTEEAI